MNGAACLHSGAVGARSAALRTVDVARRAGYGVQQIRNLERDGVLPPARRTVAGHRIYGELHLRCALAYRHLAAATAPADARRIVTAAHQGTPAVMLALLDAVHARLDTERAALRRAQLAAEAIAAEPITDVRVSDAMGISELAAALGVRPSTLRHWHAEGLVVPDRAGTTRRYTPEQVRDARIVHQLRAAGYRVAPLRALMPQLRTARRSADVRTALAARDTAITARSRALLDAAAELGTVSTLTAAREPVS
ncbi:MerR family transcriptional regulator [Solwaraspora sp. WMMA2101]|uniref:MerR family transcriptional regulator n=1 Tax=Solwaraspora sp. WMMA2101 TaxID=3404124 RepID=UPI003B954250